MKKCTKKNQLNFVVTQYKSRKANVRFYTTSGEEVPTGNVKKVMNKKSAMYCLK